MKLKVISAILLLICQLLQAQAETAGKASPTQYNAPLLEQAYIAMQRQQWDKAQEALRLYQNGVKFQKQKWLQAQALLIRVALNRDSFKEAESLISDAEEFAPRASKSSEELLLIKAEILEYHNKFLQAEKVYRQLRTSHPQSPALNAAWANNVIDRLLAGKSSDIGADNKLFNELLESYRKNEFNNQLVLMRLRQKQAILDSPDKTALDKMLRVQNWWTPENEFYVLVLSLKLRNDEIDNSYKFYLDNSSAFTYKSHPLCLTTVAELAGKLALNKLPEARAITDSLKKLIRDEDGLAAFKRLNNKILILENKLAEAQKLAGEFLKANPKAKFQKDIQTSLAEAWLAKNKFAEAQKHLKTATAIDDNSDDLRSRLQFVQASLFDNEGKHEKAAALFLRVGQTSKNKITVLKALLKSGVAFKEAKTYEKAEIALKSILDKGPSDYFDNGLFELIQCYRLWPKHEKAIEAINRLAREGKTPLLKKQALYLKGESFSALGKMTEAIEAYKEYIDIFKGPAEHARLRFKIYTIQYAKLNKTAEALKTLDEIISKDKTTDPQIYSQALHQKALIEQLRGEKRNSIKLWLQFLEFNGQHKHPLTDEVKLHLAAAYDNNEAAGSIYFELAQNGDKEVSKLALTKLLKLQSGVSRKSIDELILKLFAQNEHSWKASLLQPLMTWKLSGLEQKEKSEQTILLKSILIYLDANVPAGTAKNYWQGLCLYNLAQIEEENHKTHLEKAVRLLDDDKHSDSTLLKARCLTELQRSDDALQLYLQLCYKFTGESERDNYTNWQPSLQALQQAVKILIQNKQTSQALNLLARFEKIKLPAIQREIATLGLSFEEDKK